MWADSVPRPAADCTTGADRRRRTLDTSGDDGFRRQLRCVERDPQGVEMSTTESLRVSNLSSLSERARAITARELGTYIGRTAASQRATQRARRVMPMGVPSSFQAYDPHPIVV